MQDLHNPVTGTPAVYILLSTLLTGKNGLKQALNVKFQLILTILGHIYTIFTVKVRGRGVGAREAFGTFNGGMGSKQRNQSLIFKEGWP